MLWSSPAHVPWSCALLSVALSAYFAQMLRSDTASPYEYARHPTFAPRTRFGHAVYTVTVFTVHPSKQQRPRPKVPSPTSLLNVVPTSQHVGQGRWRGTAGKAYP